MQRDATAVPVVPLATAGAVVVALPVLYNVNPYSTHVPLCPLHALTGLNCPLCGSTRATYSLLHGHLMDALQANVLYVGAIPFLMVLWVRWYADSRSARPGQARLLPRRVSLPLLVLALAFGIIRNLPLFSPWLSPPA
jgi:hypothetical protein